MGLSTLCLPLNNILRLQYIVHGSHNLAQICFFIFLNENQMSPFLESFPSSLSYEKLFCLLVLISFGLYIHHSLLLLFIFSIIHIRSWLRSIDHEYITLRHAWKFCVIVSELPAVSWAPKGERQTHLSYTLWCLLQNFVELNQQNYIDESRLSACPHWKYMLLRFL